MTPKIYQLRVIVILGGRRREGSSRPFSRGRILQNESI